MVAVVVATWEATAEETADTAALWVARVDMVVGPWAEGTETVAVTAAATATMAVVVVVSSSGGR